jgi:hypothetical protein
MKRVSGDRIHRMTEPDDGIAAYVDVMAERVGLGLRTEHREDVIAAMRVLLQQRQLVMDFPLGEEVEPFPVATP